MRDLNYVEGRNLVISADEVLAHVTDRAEDEFLVRLRPETRVTRIREEMPESEMEAAVMRPRDAMPEERKAGQGTA